MRRREEREREGERERERESEKERGEKRLETVCERGKEKVGEKKNCASFSLQTPFMA